ncbi:hypothetical protein Dimus_010252, partial [Dionaea muscipula]
DASETSSEATPSQSLGLEPLQAVRMEEVAMSSLQEQPQVRPTSPKGKILRSQAQAQQKDLSPPAIVDSGGDEKSTQSSALVKEREPLPKVWWRQHKLEVTDDEATEDVVKDVASAQKHKKRKLTKGGTAIATTSKAENIDHRKQVVATGYNVVEYKGKEVVMEPVKVDEATRPSPRS